MGQRTFLALVSWLHLSSGIPHHGGPHFGPDTRPEHRMLMLAEDTFQPRMGLQWPDSKSHWADVPTSQSFPNQETMLEKWTPEEPSRSPSLDSRFDISSDSDDFDIQHFSSIHGKRHSGPGSPHNFFPTQDQGPPSQFESPAPAFPSNPIFQAKAPVFESFRPSGFDYQVNYEERAKRNNQRPGSSPTSTRFSPPTFDQFRPVDFKANQGQSRPIRHTSFPASSFLGDDDGHLGALPEPSATSDFGLKPFGKAGKGQSSSSHSYTTFEAPKVNSNVFIDHRQEEIKRPARASPPSSFQPPRPLRPNNVNFLPSHQNQKNHPFSTLQQQQHSHPDDNDDNVDVYDYLEGEIDHLNLNLGFSSKKRPYKQNQNSAAADDINGSPDYNR